MDNSLIDNNQQGGFGRSRLCIAGGIPLEHVCIFSGSSNGDIAAQIAEGMGNGTTPCLVERYSDGEQRIELKATVRGRQVIVVQSLNDPAAHHFMELAFFADAAKRASADKVIAAVPYFGYARGDRKGKKRAPINVACAIQMLQAAGVDHFVTMELHAGQIQGMTAGPVPFDCLYGSPVFLDWIERNLDTTDVVVVSPDTGGVDRAQVYARKLRCGLAVIDKRRSAPNVADVFNILGDVEGRDALVVDDMIDTAGTLTKGATALIAKGARRVFAIATHLVLSGPALVRLAEAPAIHKVVGSNTIAPSAEVAAHPKIEVLPVGQIFGQALNQQLNRGSVSQLFPEVNGTD